MDIIDRAITKKLHIIDNAGLCSQTWEQFWKSSENKKIFLFGLGEAGAFFISNYHASVKPEGVIDNDKSKHNFCVGDFIAEAVDTSYEDLPVSDITVLDSYTKEETVVLIASTNYYIQIMEQLKSYGIEKCYSLLMMEVNKRKKCGNTGGMPLQQIKTDYVDECCKQQVNRKKIVVHIGNYGGHGKYITEQLLRQRLNLDIVWIVNDLSKERPEGIRVIYEKNWKKYIYEMETAYIWIYDIIVPAYIRKRSEQLYIQVKHWSSITLKKFYLEDLSTTCTEEEISLVKYNGENMDYIFSGSRFDEETCRKGFMFGGTFIRIGSPRSDVLFHSKGKITVYERYHINREIKCALYAPTFRYVKTEKKKFFHIKLNFCMLKAALEQRFGGEWVILLRLHPSLAKLGRQVQKESYVIDTCDYNDSQELIAASDVTISDYSSIIFEPAFVYKPVFLFAPDLKDYVNKERELLINYDTLPFPIAESNDEIVMNIKQFDQLAYQRQVERFFEHYEVHEDGHASERAAKFIMDLLNERQVKNGEENA